MYDKYKLALLKSNYSKTKTAYERIAKQVETIGQRILEEHPMYSEDEPEQRITRAFDTYMLNESDFTAYLEMLYTEEQKVGIAHPNGIGYCADGPAKQAYIDAEKALLHRMIQDKTFNDRQRRKYKTPAGEMCFCTSPLQSEDVEYMKRKALYAYKSGKTEICS
jgi:hypothetical protein